MSAKAALLRVGKPPVELPVNRQRSLLAGQVLLELLAKCLPRAEQQRLERRDADAEHLGDLRVRAALELAHDECGALVRGQLAERTPKILDRGRRRLVGRLSVADALVERDLVRTALRLSEALATDVVRDRQQPAPRPLGADAAVERAIGVEEGRLRDVLRIRGVVEHRGRIAVDVTDVARVQALESLVVPAPENWSHLSIRPLPSDSDRPARRILGRRGAWRAPPSSLTPYGWW